MTEKEKEIFIQAVESISESHPQYMIEMKGDHVWCCGEVAYNSANFDLLAAIKLLVTVMDVKSYIENQIKSK